MATKPEDELKEYVLSEKEPDTFDVRPYYSKVGDFVSFCWTTVGWSRIPPTVSPGGIENRPGGGPTSAGGSECAITRWPNCSTPSSAQAW